MIMRTPAKVGIGMTDRECGIVEVKVEAARIVQAPIDFPDRAGKGGE